jgi:hypothetical protein
MVNPDDDFDDDFEDDAVIDDEDNSLDAATSKSDPHQLDARRRIEDILEKRRLQQEIGDLDLD